MRKHSPSKSGFKFKLASILVVFIVLISSALFIYTQYNLAPVSKTADPTVFTIDKGESITSIGNKLKASNLIKSPLFFKLYIRLNDMTNQIQAGEFTLSPSQSLTQLIVSLTTGKNDIWVTIPEGLRNEELIDILVKKFNFEPQELTVLTNGKQGYLYPDTYLVPQNETAEGVIAIILSNYEQKISPLREQITQSGFSEQEIITLASIVERETLSSEEKPLVSGILLKRLASDWALETDATIQYIIGSDQEWWPVPTLYDREVASPYNTYQNLGLPPGPICSPSLDTIMSVLEPSPSEYWFYLHDKSGNIHYGKTLEEHNRNIEKYIR